MELRVAEAVIYCARVLLLPGTLAIIRWLTHQGDTGARHVELLNCCRNLMTFSEGLRWRQGPCCKAESTRAVPHTHTHFGSARTDAKEDRQDQTRRRQIAATMHHHWKYGNSSVFWGILGWPLRRYTRVISPCFPSDSVALLGPESDAVPPCLKFHLQITAQLAHSVTMFRCVHTHTPPVGSRAGLAPTSLLLVLLIKLQKLQPLFHTLLLHVRCPHMYASYKRLCPCLQAVGECFQRGQDMV